MAATPPRHLLIPGELLDYYLNLGYYRMQQQVFTCRFLPHDGQLYAVHWLRVVLADVAYGPKQRQLLRQNFRFTVSVQPFRFTAEYEELYTEYYYSVGFDTAPTLEYLLLGDNAPNQGSVFDTHIVEVRDEGHLIAAGIFDNGARSISGIVNFYHPDYAKFSLGKYLMLCKIGYARQQGKTYYYPGYLAYGYSKFDYKLFAATAATEAFDCLTSTWHLFAWDEVAARSAALLALREAGDKEM